MKYAIVIAIVILGFLIQQRFSQRVTHNNTVNHTFVDDSLSAIALCDQYRKWQSLPEIYGTITGMDDICKKINK